MRMIARSDISGLVLSGGLGTRMGGVDKGLLRHLGLPLAEQAVRRLAPQVGSVRVNANRHLPDYEAMGVAVVSDSLPAHPGPLAGILAGLETCPTQYLVSVPCDVPHFPLDLVRRLADALEAESAELAVAATLDRRAIRVESVFCLMRSTLAPSIARFLASGERRVEAWTARHRRAQVIFEPATAFLNVNTPDDLARLEAPG